MWLHRRSEEPAVTSVACYWKHSKLSAVSKTIKFVKGKNIGKKEVIPLYPHSGVFRQTVLDNIRMTPDFGDTQLTKYYRERDNVEKLSIHYLLQQFCQINSVPTADEFVNYCSSQMLEGTCTEAAIKTLQQAKSSLWFELRYGRITASKAHEGAHCHTLEGSLVENILGAISIKDTAAMKRGRHLEIVVRKKVESERAIKISVCGFYLSSEYPIMGASPDGISDDYVIEIKCPNSEKAMKNYICDGKITNKFKGQIQMQMLFAKKSKGLFCVASPDFENTNEISILDVEIDMEYCENIVKSCVNFWKLAVFPMLIKDFV